MHAIPQVTDHLFVFEGNGVVKDYIGTLTDYAECLVEQENADDFEGSGPAISDEEKKTSYKEDKAKRNERRNKLRQLKKDLNKVEPKIEKLKAKAEGLQKEMDDSADEGWTVLADLTEKLQVVNDEIEENEMLWLEVAEELETLEEEEASMAN